MNDFLEKLEISIKEAKNFLRKAELCESVLNAYHEENEFYPYHSKERAACKRASMDLSNALAKLRKAQN